MKKYFTKYLPTEGEIKVGDSFKDRDGNILVADEDDDLTLINSEYQKIKFSLCSRDIQVGDIVVDIVTDCSITITDDDYNIIAAEGAWHNYAKPIGEVSPDATWVKEGDEFDEDEIRLKVYEDHPYAPFYEGAYVTVVGVREYLDTKEISDNLNEVTKMPVQFRCPHCKQFS